MAEIVQTDLDKGKAKDIDIQGVDDNEADGSDNHEEEKILTEEEQRQLERRKVIDAYHARKEAQRKEEQRLKEEMDKPGPLQIGEAHQNFYLEKKIEADMTIGLPNNRHIVCKFCEVIIVPEGQATKEMIDVDLVQNNMREFDLCDTCWKVDQLSHFQNIEVHQMDDHLKYLCCLSCQSAIIGYI